MFHKVKGSGTLPLFLFTMSVTWVVDVIHGHIGPLIGDHESDASTG